MGKRFYSQQQMSESLITAAILSASGGLQDAYTYLCRGEVFANAATGNIVLLNVHVIEGEWIQALHYLVPVLAYATGVFVSEWIRHVYPDKGWLHWRQFVLVVEILLLAAVGFMPQAASINMLANAMVSFSCAMQVQAFRKVTGYAFASTMCIGNMRAGMEAFYGYLSSRNPAVLRKALRYLEIIVLFGIGAGVGGHLVAALGTRTIWISCALLAVAFSLMFIREEEAEIEELKEEIEHLEQSARGSMNKN